MTKEQYERAALATRQIKNLKYALNAMESEKDAMLSIQWFTDYCPIPDKVVINDAELKNIVKDYLTRRIAELEKEFEEL